MTTNPLKTSSWRESMKLEKPVVYKNYFESYPDKRGFLSTASLKKLNLNILQDFEYAYQLISNTPAVNTFRGFHYQARPASQNKVILVHSGTIIDFVVPLSNLKFENIKKYELSVGDIILIPEDYAHGFITTSPNVTLQYILYKEYSQNHYKGINGIEYLENIGFKNNFIISEKDKELPNKII